MGDRTDQSDWNRYTFSQPLMGTQFRIVLYAPDEATAMAVADAAFARATRLNKHYSDYDRKSELTRLNRTSGGSGGTEPVKLSPELYDVLARSEYWYYKSGGAFDVSVGPIVRLWRWARRNHKMPSQDNLKEAIAATGFDKVALDPQRKTARLTVPGMRLDLGGIAKGYTADIMIAVLESRGITRALVDAGGDIVVSDAPPGKIGWKVALLPLPNKDKHADAPKPRYVLLTHAAIATSGDTFQHVVLDGKRYSHIVDPRTGLGLTNQLGVSVIVHRSKTHAAPGADADALASALNVLGPAKALKLIDTLPDAAALIMQQHPDGTIETFESASLAETGEK